MTTKSKLAELVHKRNKLLKRIHDHQVSVMCLSIEIKQLEKEVENDTTR